MATEKIFRQLLQELATPEIRGVVGNINKMEAPVATVKVVEVINAVIECNNYSLCLKDGIIYCYNGRCWVKVQEDEIKLFIHSAVDALGGDNIGRKHYRWKTEVYKQFMSEALFVPKEKTEGQTLINLRNGTFEITAEHQLLREYRAEDFLRYCLDFDYDPQATAPMFQKFLDRVLPDKDCQAVLSEYMGYIFSKGLKLEKVLLLTGSGANGKSTFFNIATAIFGQDNVSSFSLQELTKGQYQRAELQDVIVNFCSEISGKMETAVFKQLASGEPVSARHIFGRPFTMTDYAKMVFLCNELPWQIEQTDAFFRRFIIIPFEQTIPEEERDPDLANKIIASERSGVFNWMLGGLKRLLKNKRFTDSEVIRRQIELFRYERDTVAVFLDQKNYVPSILKLERLADIYDSYTVFCMGNRLRSVSRIAFSRKLQSYGYAMKREDVGYFVYIEVNSDAKRKRVSRIDLANISVNTTDETKESGNETCNGQQKSESDNVEASAPAKRPVRSIPNKKKNETLPEIHSK